MDVLLNWLAQGVIVAIATAGGLRVIPPSAAAARYGFVWAGYLVVLALPAVPLALAATGSAGAVDNVAAVPAAPLTIPTAWWTSAAVASGLWFTWLGFHAVQFAAGVLAVREARRCSQACPRDVLAALPHWASVHAAGRPARVVLSDRVPLAAVLGCGAPIIALAPRLLAQLSAADLDRILVHEWAHVQRRDDLVQLAQRIVRAIVGWHPAAWWLERQLELEREAACDEVAVRVTGSAKAYAACLAGLAALAGNGVRFLPVLAAISTSQLRLRVVRILAGRSGTDARRWNAWTMCGAAGLVALSPAVSSVRIAASEMARTVQLIASAERRAQRTVGDTAVASGRAATPTPSSSATSPRLRAGGAMKAAPQEREHRGDRTRRAMAESPQPAGPRLLPSTASPADAETPAPPDAAPPEVNIAAKPIPVTTFIVDAPASAGKTRAPWSVAAEVGAAIGRRSQDAGKATTGFFTRFGTKIAGSF